MEEIKKDMLDGDDEDDGDYMDRLREVSGTGLVNTRIADRESEVFVTNCTILLTLINIVDRCLQLISLVSIEKTPENIIAW